MNEVKFNCPYCHCISDAAIVKLRSEPLSWSSTSGGYSIYAERKYFIDKRIVELKHQLGQFPGLRDRACDNYNEVLDNINKQQDNVIKQIEKLSQEKEIL